MRYLNKIIMESFIKEIEIKYANGEVSNYDEKYSEKMIKKFRWKRGRFIVGIFFIFGLVIGSFLNVCIFRIPKGESIAYPPSHCGSCGYNLKAMDLVPVLSYLFLKGRCKNCKEKISLRYPVIELINAISYILIYMKFGFSIKSIFFCILTSLLIVISMIDFDTKEVYTATTLFGLILGIVYLLTSYIFSNINYMYNIWGGAVGFLIIFLIVKLTQGMGEGDCEIAGVCGLFLGLKGILIGLFIGVILGAIYGSILIIRKNKTGKDEMAFGPFIAIGSFIALLYGTEIFNLYINIFI